MIVFGCCVGPSGKYDTVARPGIELARRHDDRVILETGVTGICAVYNRILDEARAIPDCEAVVLLHDDVQFTSPAARGQILRPLSDPSVGIVGAVGGRGLFGPQWVGARRLAGEVTDFYGHRRFGPRFAEVDVVDGLLLALGPRAIRELRFPEDVLTRFHGYDTDICLQARAMGLKVRVVPVDLLHRDKGNVGDATAFEESRSVLLRRWPDQITPLRASERPRIWAREHVRPRLGALRHRAAVATKSLRHSTQGPDRTP
ncbi:glycosyltransferase [Knoellia remsis]|uniref:glycosyltransferase n=1 Tax=Knoellia remsis TaxID=407159 RepID=UPI0014755D1E|nr:glycosyltransferase [Knoellia remsis]